MFSINVLLNYKQLGDSPSRTAASTADCATLANKLLVPTKVSVVCKVSHVGLPIDQPAVQLRVRVCVLFCCPKIDTVCSAGLGVPSKRLKGTCNRIAKLRLMTPSSVSLLTVDEWLIFRWLGVRRG